MRTVFGCGPLRAHTYNRQILVCENTLIGVLCLDADLLSTHTYTHGHAQLDSHPGTKTLSRKVCMFFENAGAQFLTLKVHQWLVQTTCKRVYSCATRSKVLFVWARMRISPDLRLHGEFPFPLLPKIEFPRNSIFFPRNRIFRCRSLYGP